MFVWPPRPIASAVWFLRNYVLSWNLFIALVALATWTWASPSLQTASSLEPGWVLGVFIRNLAIVLVFYGAWHSWLITRRSQGVRFKYDPRWPKQRSALFTFGNQTRDNIFWSLASGVPIWTAVEIFMLWAMANGHAPTFAFGDHPVWFVALMLAIPIYRDVHFYMAHRLLHVKWIYARFHKLHHNNTNPAPFSGLAMHPVEHLIYFTGVLIHFVVPAHPLHVVYQLMHAGLAPAPGHAGFAEIELGTSGATISTGGYNHYLHHKYFECNYADGVLPLDKWFGTFHDGSPDAHVAMQARMRARRQA